MALIKLHHVTAIEMARREKEWGKSEKMIAIAKHIIEDESEEVDELDSYEHTHKPNNKSDTFFVAAQRLFLHKHTPSEAGNIDQVFAEILLQHHKSAMALSELYLKSSTDPTVQKLAQHVLGHHGRNIIDLENLIQELEAQPK